MKSLTYSESQTWLAPRGILIDEHRNLLFRPEKPTVMTTMPKGVSALRAFSERIVRWLSLQAGSFFWLSNWHTEPAHFLTVFEKLRMGCGESRHIIDAPGHHFENSESQETNILIGVVFLVMAFDWQGYVVTDAGNEFIFFGDEYIVFHSDDYTKTREFSGILTTFGLEIIKDVRQAWK